MPHKTAIHLQFTATVFTKYCWLESIYAFVDVLRKFWCSFFKKFWVKYFVFFSKDWGGLILLYTSPTPSTQVLSVRNRTRTSMMWLNISPSATNHSLKISALLTWYKQKQMANRIFTMTALGFIGHNYLLIPVTVKFYFLFLLVGICGVKRLLNWSKETNYHARGCF